MRWLVKIGTLGLAAFGAQRLYEIVKPRVETIRDQTEPKIHDAVRAVKDTAENLRGDVSEASSNLREDLHPAVEQLKRSATEIGDVVHDEVIGSTKDETVTPSPIPIAPAVAAPRG